MQLKKSIIPITSDEIVKVNQSNTDLQNETPDMQINDLLVPNAVVIWLDSTTDANDIECRNTIEELRHIAHTIHTFTDGDQCIEFLENMNNNQACMIISDSFAETIIPRVHDMSQVNTIFVFSNDKRYYKQWLIECSKIKGVYTEVSFICEALKQEIQQCEQNTLSISIISSDNGSKKKLDQLDPSFIYTQIIKEISLTNNFEEQHIDNFLNYCRNVFAENDHALKNIKNIGRKYHNEILIGWHTFEYFLYPMLNRALRLIEVDIIMKLSFFINDLHRYIEKLHNEQFNSLQSTGSFTVYYGQSLSIKDFEKMNNNKGGLISFNNFFTASKTRVVALNTANDALLNPDLVGVIFVMTMDPSQSTTTPYGFINNANDVLFSIQTIFRICNITSLDDSQRLYQVDLILTGDNDQDLSRLTNYIRESTSKDLEGWSRLGEVLRRIGRFDKAEELFQILLEQATNECEKGTLWHQLGLLKYHCGEYKNAITFYEKAAGIYDNNLPSNNRSLYSVYTNMGVVSDRMGEHAEALSYYERALAIQQATLSSHHPDLALSYNNIGSVHENIGDYSKAVAYYEKALTTQEQILSPNHPDLALSCISIAGMYYKIGDYPKSISLYEKGLEMQQRTLPSNHPDLAMSYIGLGMVCNETGEHSKSVDFYEKALEIQQQTLPPNHLDLAMTYGHIGNVYSAMGQYSKALSYYEKSLDIKKQSLPSNHPQLGSLYNNIGGLYGRTGIFAKALPYFEKSLEIQQQSLPSNHPDLGASYSNLGAVYEKMGNYSSAYSFYERSIEIAQQSVSADHPILKQRQKNRDRVKKKL